MHVQKKKKKKNGLAFGLPRVILEATLVSLWCATANIK